MTTRAALVLVLAGCRFNFDPVGVRDDAGGDDATDGAPGDDPGDASGDADLGCAWTFTPSNAPLMAPGPSLILDQAGAYVIDTTDGTLTGPGGPITISSVIVAQAGGPELMVVPAMTLILDAAASLSINAPVRPLVLMVHNTVIDGVIDVVGPSSTCAGGAGVPGTGAGGSGGGGGFGDTGGLGAGTGPGAAGGIEGNAALVPLRGGCNGGRGGMNGGLGGVAGGALQISTCKVLALRGTIASTGRGGGGGSFVSLGGGGGGAGGSIVLEAATIVLADTARVCANGGAGGEGNLSATPSQGAIGTCSASVGAVTSNTDVGGNGGNGGYRGAPAGAVGAASGSNGGGGGGGAGRIRISTADLQTDPNVVISPAHVP